MNTTTELSIGHRASLTGFSTEHQEVVAQFGYRTVTREQAHSILGDNGFDDCAGMAIPFHSMDGTEIKGYRIRLDTERDYTDKNQKECHQKYAQSKGDFLGLYFPSNFSMDELDSTATVLYICESEKKAEALAGLGYDAVGLTGICTWAVKKDAGDSTRTLLPELLTLSTLVDRMVVVFDNDIHNPTKSVLFELATLLKTLQGTKENTRWVALPDGEAKGVDDFLAINGVESTKTLLAAQHPVEPMKQLASKIEMDSGLRMRYAQAWYGKGKRYLAWQSAALESNKVTNEAVVESCRGTDVRAYLRTHIESKKLTYSYRTQGLVSQGKFVDSSVFMSDLQLDAARDAIAKVNSSILSAAWISYAHNEDLKAIEAIKAQIEFNADRHMGNKPTDALLRKWVEAVTGKVNELDVAAIKQFIWQVKCKLFGRQVDHHLMPVLFGETGGGKTRALEMLFGPVSEIQDASKDLSILADERQSFRLARNYIMFFDEMGNAAKADVAALKSSITSSSLTWRNLGHNTANTAVNNATMIGASNKHVRDLVKDDTSARRFWEIDTIKQGPKEYAIVDGINYLDVWRCVSYKDECPLQSVLTQVQKIQNSEIRHKSMLEEFFDDHTAVGGKTTAAALHTAYCQYLTDRQVKGVLPTARSMGVEISDRKLAVRGHDRKGNYYECSIIAVQHPMYEPKTSTQPVVAN